MLNLASDQFCIHVKAVYCASTLSSTHWTSTRKDRSCAAFGLMQGNVPTGRTLPGMLLWLLKFVQRSESGLAAFGPHFLESFVQCHFP